MDDVTAQVECLLRPGGGRLALEARDPARNLARGWRIGTGRDLFGSFVVTWGWGRIGTAGQIRTIAFPGPVEARPFIRRLLLRRGRAVTRIGAAYRPAR